MADAHEVISATLEEIDQEYMAYQALHHRYHRSDDEVAKMIHKRLVDLCRRLLKEIPKGSE
jgi:hypothetical protein